MGTTVAAPGGTPPFLPPDGGTSSWLDTLLSGGSSFLNSFFGQPGGGAAPGTPGGPGYPGGAVPGGGPQSPWDVAAGAYANGNPNNLFLGNADLTASGQLQQGYGNGIDTWLQALGLQTQNQSPYMGAGASSIGALMQGLKNGTFGPGSLPTVPTFTAPTLEQAQQQPGYQFTLQQGNKGLAQASAAAGGAVSGGTVRAADLFNQNAATTNYQQVYNNALQGYGANLAGYNANLAGQNQEFQQLFQPSVLGQTASNQLNTNIGTGALNIGQLMSLIGAAQAAGTLGSTKDYLGIKPPGSNNQPGSGPGGSGGGVQGGPMPGPIGGPYPGANPPPLNPPGNGTTSTITGTGPAQTSGVNVGSSTPPTLPPAGYGAGSGFWAPDPGGGWQWVAKPGTGASGASGGDSSGGAGDGSGGGSASDGTGGGGDGSGGGGDQNTGDQGSDGSGDDSSYYDNAASAPYAWQPGYIDPTTGMPTNNGGLDPAMAAQYSTAYNEPGSSTIGTDVPGQWAARVTSIGNLMQQRRRVKSKALPG